MLVAIRIQASIVSTRFHLQLESLFSRTSHVECSVACRFGALDTGSDLFAAEVTQELPSALTDVLYSINGLHVDCIGDSRVGYPDGAQQMSPLGRRSLLERAVGVWAQNARLQTSWSGQATSKLQECIANNLRRACRGRRCIYGRAIDLLEYKVLHNSLLSPGQCSAFS